MNKKIFIFLFFLGFLSFFLFPKNAYAGCGQLGNEINCGRGLILCNANNGQQYCCTQLYDSNKKQIACSQVPGGATQATSETASGPKPTTGCNDTAINTAIGCIDFQDTNGFVGQIFKFAVGIGGGIAFLLIVYAGFTIMTSTGNPERLKDGQDLLTSAISGLILLIFAVFVLKVIGVDILGLGKFGFGTSNSGAPNVHQNQINGNQ